MAQAPYPGEIVGRVEADSTPCFAHPTWIETKSAGIEVGQFIVRLAPDAA